MRVLITGICGFVGSTLARGLRENRSGWQIVGVDSRVRPGSEGNRLGLRRLGVKVFHADLRSPSDLEALPACGWILDAAATTHFVCARWSLAETIAEREVRCDCEADPSLKHGSA